MGVKQIYVPPNRQKEETRDEKSKTLFWDKVRYQFDNLMARGTIALVQILLLIKRLWL